MEKNKAELIDNFGYLEDWQARYAYIIELGRGLPVMPEALKTAEHAVKGCQSQVWLVGECRAGCMYFQAASDAVLVSGLLAILLAVYNAQKCEAIVADEADFIDELGLARHLSPTRSNGLYAVLRRMKAMAHSSSRVSE